MDTGKMADILAANRAVLDASQACAAPRPGVEIIPPVAISADATIEESRIGPHVSIGPGCVIRNSSLENSILMDEAVVEDCPGIRDSIVGRFAVARRAPAGSVLTLGDLSCFEGPG
jgi:glucose-1-phosphate thymidylyltransferase